VAGAERVQGHQDPPLTAPAPDHQELTCDGVAHGGEAVGRLADGRAVFVPYAIPGERVRVRVTDQRARFARAELLEVLKESPDRVAPPCPEFGPGRCGGCAWQHIRPAAQAELKRRLVAEQLAHVAGMHRVDVRATLRPQAPSQPDGLGYRERATLTAAGDGRLGFLRHASHEVHPVARCPLLAGPLQELPGLLGRHPPGTKVRLRHGAGGERLVVLAAGGRDRAPPPPLDGGIAWAAVRGNGKVAAGHGAPSVTERVAGTAFQVGAASFFQVHRTGADLLVELVAEALAPRPSELLVDVYAGVGLFAATVGARAGRVVAIESWRPAARDARHNLRDRPGATVIADDAARGLRRLRHPPGGCVVVLDPPRAGVGRATIAEVSRLRPRSVALVSCDPAALARDLRAFADAGYPPRWVQPVDLFPQTAHVEAVTALSPAGSE
jgi:tRNA/tmRNA/rRNA uracil-C5-methylase (TrmA/RlmC/RlmD family)